MIERLLLCNIISPIRPCTIAYTFSSAIEWLGENIRLISVLFAALAGIVPEYLEYLKTERIQLALGGLTLLVFFVDTLHERFTSMGSEGDRD